MKTISTLVFTLIFMASLVPQLSLAQSSYVDQVFDQFSADENFTYVNISGHMLQIMSNRHGERGRSVASKMDRIRILTSNQVDNESVSQAFSNLSSTLMNRDFDELMEIRDGGSHFRFLTTGENDRISQFLLIGNDQSQHILISIEGDLSLDDLSQSSYMVPGLEGLQGFPGRD